jgi:hypothetical protein
MRLRLRASQEFVAALSANGRTRPVASSACRAEIYPGGVEAFRFLGSARASRVGDGALAIANFISDCLIEAGYENES